MSDFAAVRGDADALAKLAAQVQGDAVALAGLAAQVAADIAVLAAPVGLFASPSGSDSALGTITAPFRTPAKLLAAIAQTGQVGYLRDGAYGTLSAYHDLAASGTGTSPLRLTAYPGEKPIITGFVEVNGSFVHLDRLTIDGSNTLYPGPNACGNSNVTASLGVKGSDCLIEYCDYHQSVVALRGNALYVRGDRLTVRFCKFHDIGGCQAFDHGIYLGHGSAHQVYGNWIWNVPHGWGVQLYPSCVGAHVYANVIDRCGAGFVISGEASSPSASNLVEKNIVVNATGLPSAANLGVGISDWWAGTPGAGNVFRGNDVFNCPGGVSKASAAIALSANVTSDPRFLTAVPGDYRIPADSPVGGWGLWDGTVPNA